MDKALKLVTWKNWVTGIIPIIYPVKKLKMNVREFLIAGRAAYIAVKQKGKDKTRNKSGDGLRRFIYSFNE